jgi:hypothetical protein
VQVRVSQWHPTICRGTGKQSQLKLLGRPEATLGKQWQQGLADIQRGLVQVRECQARLQHRRHVPDMFACNSRGFCSFVRMTSHALLFPDQMRFFLGTGPMCTQWVRNSYTVSTNLQYSGKSIFIPFIPVWRSTGTHVMCTHLMCAFLVWL